jgi:hypothetical protein
MAIENKWVDASVADGKLGNAANVMPGRLMGFAETFEVAAADDDGSIYKLAKLGANLIPFQLKLNCDAIAGAVSYDLGLYTEEGDAKDQDCFVAALDIHAGAAIGTEVECLAAIGVENIGSKKVYEYAGDTEATKQEAYVLAITANTVGTAAGTISVRGLFLQG